MHLRAGQEPTPLRLHSGEEIRTGRIALLFWDSDARFAGRNACRKLLINHYLLRRDGQVITPLVSMLNIQHVLDMPPIQQTRSDIDRSAKLGDEVFRIDASWFLGDFRYDVTEIKYVEGFYAMWDALHARCPRRIISN